MYRAAIARATLIEAAGGLRGTNILSGRLDLQRVLQARATGIGCSRWFSSSPRVCQREAVSAASHEIGRKILNEDNEDEAQEDLKFEFTEEILHDDERGMNSEEVVIQSVEESLPSSKTHPTTPQRPKLPTSIKKLNKLLSHSPKITIPESDLSEKFIRGSGPGGQAINKTSSSVSLIHIPTGIRAQAQPTRSREQNRKVARRILGEKLDLWRVRGGWSEVGGWKLVGSKEDDFGDEDIEAECDPYRAESGGEDSVKTVELSNQSTARAYSREEIKWEKERRRKLNRAKKTKKKQKGVETSIAETSSPKN